MSQFNPLVKIHRSIDSVDDADIYFNKIRNIRWRDDVRCLGKILPQPFLSGLITCTDCDYGYIAHSGKHCPCPHDIAIFILKKDNEEIWDTLIKMYPRPRRLLASPITKAMKDKCVNDILDSVISHKKIDGVEFNDRKSRWEIHTYNLSLIKKSNGSIHTKRRHLKYIRNSLMNELEKLHIVLKKYRDRWNLYKL